MKRFCLLFFIFMLATACTENLLFENKINRSQQSTIRGTVRLSDNASPEGIFIWLESLEIFTRTDAQGDFELQLPLPHVQPGGGLSIFLRLFIYVENYRYHVSNILLLDGEAAYGEGDLDDSGRVNPDITLQKILEIETTVEPVEIDRNTENTLFITTSLNNLTDTVFVQTYGLPNGEVSCVIFRDINKSAEEALFERDHNTSLKEQLITRATEWKMSFPLDSAYFESGVYEVLPYLRIRQPDLPEPLLRDLGAELSGFSSEYFQIPFRQQTAELTVTGSE